MATAHFEAFMQAFYNETLAEQEQTMEETPQTSDLQEPFDVNGESDEEEDVEMEDGFWDTLTLY